MAARNRSLSCSGREGLPSLGADGRRLHRLVQVSSEQDQETGDRAGREATTFDSMMRGALAAPQPPARRPRFD